MRRRVIATEEEGVQQCNNEVLSFHGLASFVREMQLHFSLQRCVYVLLNMLNILWARVWKRDA